MLPRCAVAKSTYPHDPRDPRLRSCKRCGDRYMPPAFCDVHDRTCQTCCSRLGLQCGLRAATKAVDNLAATMAAFGDSAKGAAKATDAYRAAVQADIDALYGPKEDRADTIRRIDTSRLED